MPSTPCKYTEKEFLDLWERCGRSQREFAKVTGVCRQNVPRYLKKYDSTYKNNPVTHKLKTHVILPDVHIEPGVINPVAELAYDFIQSIRPYCVITSGDFLNLDCVNPHLTNKLRAVENKRLLVAYDEANKVLAEKIRPYTEKIIYIEGNHEDWIRQYIDKDPRCGEGILELSRNIKSVDEFIGPYNDHTKNFYMIGPKLKVIHGNYVGENACKRYLATRTKSSILFSNTHRIEQASKTMDDASSLYVYNNGALCAINPSYLKGELANWQLGFSVVDLWSSGNFDHYQICIKRDGDYIAFSYNKKLYRRYIDNEFLRGILH